MALSYFNGTSSWENCDVMVFLNSGFTIDHVADDDSLSSGGVSNMPQLKHGQHVWATNCKFLTRGGIGSVRVPMNAYLAEQADYLCIAMSNSGNTSIWDGGVSSDANEVKITVFFYFITQATPLNRKVVEFSIMCDCLTTFRYAGGNISDFGGYITRRRGDTLNNYAEPYTFGYNPRYSIRLLDATDIVPESGTRKDTYHTGAFILSQYDLDDTTAITARETTDTTTKTSTSGSTATGGRTIGYASAKTSSIITNFKVGARQFNLGLTLYRRVPAVVKRISELYAAGITNVVADAYSCAYGSISYNGNAVTTITGAANTNAYLDIPGLASSFYPTNKSDVYGRYVTILSLGTGESQTYPLSEVVSGRRIHVDSASDPSPDGTFSLRIRYNSEDVDNDGKGVAFRAFLPGGVTSGRWRRVTVQSGSDGSGVSSGQAFRLASLDIEANIAALNQAAANAQYDLTVGNGYLLSNAGNEYGLQTLSSRMAAQSQLHQNALAGNTISQIGNAANAASGAVSSFLKADIAGGIGNIAGGVGQAAQLGLSRSNENINYTNQQTANNISRTQMQEQGEYNTALLRAQAAAGTAVAQANIDRLNLVRQQVSEFPSSDLLSIAKGGLLQGNANLFAIIYTEPDGTDVARLKNSMAYFGETVYIENNERNKPGTGFYKFEIPASWKNYSTYTQNGATHHAYKFPGWMMRGVVSQLTNGVWFI